MAGGAIETVCSGQYALPYATVPTLMFVSKTLLNQEIFRHSQEASVLHAVTGSKQAEKILGRDMEDSDRVIDRELLSSVIEEGKTRPNPPAMGRHSHWRQMRS